MAEQERPQEIKSPEVKKACPVCKTNEHVFITNPYMGQPAVVPQKIPAPSKSNIIVQSKTSVPGKVMHMEQLSCGECGVAFFDFFHIDDVELGLQAMTKEQAEAMQRQAAAAAQAAQQAGGGMPGFAQ